MQNVMTGKVFHVMVRGEILCLKPPLGQKRVSVNWAEVDFVPYNRKRLATCKACLDKLKEIEKKVSEGEPSPLPPPRKQCEPRKKRLPVTPPPPLVASDPLPQPVIPEVVTEVASKEEAAVEEIPPKKPEKRKYWFHMDISKGDPSKGTT